LHSLLDALSCWKGLNSIDDVNRLSNGIMNLKKKVGIDFEGKLGLE
ncbi:MAG: hypothetical protein H3Z53_03465, partial [archaeon]|nr:hypothetical protein [archaeon]